MYIGKDFLVRTTLGKPKKTLDPTHYGIYGPANSKDDNDYGLIKLAIAY